MSAKAGAHTAEGNAAGAFAARLESQREQRHADFEAKKAALAAESKRTGNADERFSALAQTADIEAEFKARTTGLVTADAYRLALSAVAAQEAARQLKAAGAAPTAPAAAAAAPALAAPTSSSISASCGPAGNRTTTAGKRPRPALSFMGQLEEEEEDTSDRGIAAASQASAASHAGTVIVSSKRPRVLTKDPTVATGFLPDPEREAAEARLRASLEAEWAAQQERARAEKIEVVYSWWDGTGHRRTIVVPKGASVGRFLEWVRQDLLVEFPALRALSSDALLFVKEDCIMPHGVTFHELIARKARGKSGPLFAFDVHDDVRTLADARVEKDESHPGKIVERRWYEKNKHAFPASRWEVFDWASQDAYASAGYTTHGREVTAAAPRKG